MNVTPNPASAMRVHWSPGSDRPRRAYRRQRQPVTVARVDPLVWAVALDLADYNPARIRVLDQATVLVRNR